MSSSGRPLAIIAGGGSLPVHVAEAARLSGRKLLVVGIEGEADPDIAAFSPEWINWGQIGKLERLLAEHGTQDIVLIGNISARPDFKHFRLDFGTVRILPEVVSILIGGDNTVLSGAIRLLEARGYSIVGAHEIAADLTASGGPAAGVPPRGDDLLDLETAIRASRDIGALDAGQAAVAIGGRVVALEAAEGTDAMLERVAGLRRDGRLRANGRAGVLAKCAKPQQDLRVDMPTIGPKTVEGAAAAGLAGIGIEAGRVMIVDRAETLRRAEATGLFIFAVDHTATA
ncbi:MAG TPA: UDP-2,3-diacylglucosamine diphosphatase LpxI [Pararhizobium sp.]|nr:UDP-2,3-diacylglucosamine diphosphatase LpxI [Pararhizobium sp.]